MLALKLRQDFETAETNLPTYRRIWRMVNVTPPVCCQFAVGGIRVESNKATVKQRKKEECE